MNPSHFQRDSWAYAWARRAPLIEPLVALVLDALAVRTGERVVDVGTGLGPLASGCARLVGPTGFVLGVDLSPQALALARARAGDMPPGVLDFACLDAGSADFPGAPYDAAASLLGVMFFPDPVRAFANVRRHLRPGGRLAMGVWAGEEDNPLLPEVLLRGFASAATCAAPFSLADPAVVLAVLAEAGWTDVNVDTTRTVVRAGPEVVFQPGLLAVYDVPAAVRATALAHVSAVVGSALRNGVVHVPLALNVVTARALPRAGTRT